MRERLFRGKTTDGKWLFGYLIKVGAFYYIQNDKGGNEPVIENTIGQFTGLTDKNGVNIFEGDICKASKPNSYLNGDYIVAWHETKGRWYYYNQPTYKDLYQVGCSGNLKCEVIGNIHE